MAILDEGDVLFKRGETLFRVGDRVTTESDNTIYVITEWVKFDGGAPPCAFGIGTAEGTTRFIGLYETHLTMYEQGKGNNGRPTKKKKSP